MNGKRLLVLGASGPTGRHLVSQALARGHTVTALARRAGALELDRPDLRFVACDVTQDQATLAQALEGQDAVISALGRGLSFRSQHLQARAARVLVPLLERLGPKRFVYLSAFGVGEMGREAPWLPWLFIHTMLVGIYRDKAIAESLLRASRLDWTIVSPVQLTDRLATSRYRVGEHLPLRGAPSVARADVAEAILNCLADPATIGKALIVAP